MKKESGLNKMVVSFANDYLNYQGGVARIRKSLQRQKFDGLYYSWKGASGVFPPGCPSHLDAPYAFKIWCLREAERQGTDLVLYLDSSIVPLNIHSVFDKIETQGIYLLRRKKQVKAKRVVGQVCSDEVLTSFKMSREEAMNIPQISAGRIGLDLRNSKAQELLKTWEERSLDGLSFKGYRGEASREKSLKMRKNIDLFASRDPCVKGHRHDQTILSILVHQLGISWSVELEDELRVDKKFAKMVRPNFYQQRGLTSFFDFFKY